VGVSWSGREWLWNVHEAAASPALEVTHAFAVFVCLFIVCEGGIALAVHCAAIDCFPALMLVAAISPDGCSCSLLVNVRMQGHQVPKQQSPMGVHVMRPLCHSWDWPWGCACM
jgi:hypothetical protein